MIIGNYNIDIMLTGPMGVNTYVVRPGEGRDCVVIDPADGERVSDFLSSEGLSCRAVLLTHCHFDHILAVGELRKQGIKTYIGSGDAPGLRDRVVNLCPNYLSAQCEGCTADVELEDGDIVNEAGMNIRVINTPGHTAGGVCYLLEEGNIIFSGDTLFRRGVGRYDLPGGNALTLFGSINDRLFALEGDYRVFPGHGDPTTMEEERKGNLYMKVDPHKW